MEARITHNYNPVMPLCFLMCLLVHVRPAVVCDIVLLSALFVFKSLVSPILTKIDSLYVVEIDHFGLKKSILYICSGYFCTISFFFS